MQDSLKVPKHKKQAALLSNPYVSANKQDERSAYAMLKLWLPHGCEADLLDNLDEGADEPYATAVEALEAKWAHLWERGRSVWDRTYEIASAAVSSLERVR